MAGLLAAQSDERVWFWKLVQTTARSATAAGRGSPRRASPRLHPRLELRLRRYLSQPCRELRTGESHRRVLCSQRLRSDLGQPGRLRRLGGLGLTGWSSAELLPFSLAPPSGCVCRYARHEATPFQQACLDAAPGAGIPLTDDLNDFDQDEGMATSPVNILTARAGMPRSPISIRSGSDRT